MRIVIVGPPKTGKTTIANQCCRDEDPDQEGRSAIYHTDDLIAGRSWPEQGDAAYELLLKANRDDPDGFVYEGVLAVRALSRWLKTHAPRPLFSPCDQLLVLTVPRVAQTPEQQRLGKAVLTMLQPLIPGLRALGVEIEWDRS